MCKPVLMSAENPEGWKLEELLSTMRDELAAKNRRIVNDDSPTAQAVLQNNRMILQFLTGCENLQRDSIARLKALAPDPGPTGTPRIGVGSQAE